MISDHNPRTRRPEITLWTEIYRCLEALQPAGSRTATFLWMAWALVGLWIRPDIRGVTSFVRASWLKETAYRRLIHLFHAPALRLEDLTLAWCHLTLKIFHAITAGPYLVGLADGRKVPEEGRKMPAVKSPHTESQNNSKAP